MNIDMLKGLLTSKSEHFSNTEKKKYKIVQLFKVINKVNQSLLNQSIKKETMGLIRQTIEAIPATPSADSSLFDKHYLALRNHTVIHYKFDPDAQASVYLLVGLVFGAVLGWIIKSYWMGLPIGFLVAFVFYYVSLNNVKNHD